MYVCWIFAESETSGSMRFGRTLRFPVDRRLVVRLAEVLLGDIFRGDGAAVRVGVEEEERLEVIFDALADHVFPPGADLQQQKKKKKKIKEMTVTRNTGSESR